MNVVLMSPIYVLENGSLAVPYGTYYPYEKWTICELENDTIGEIDTKKLKSENIVGYVKARENEVVEQFIDIYGESCKGFLNNIKYKIAESTFSAGFIQ